jgi:hypothetical protein
MWDLHAKTMPIDAMRTASSISHRAGYSLTIPHNASSKPPMVEGRFVRIADLRSDRNKRSLPAQASH